ncbi:MAG: phosphoenolpyruvate--protein phosphotransferase [Deltaproteobacteria bacterium]|nr:phosphoenolpyruvate--protein phosphotransferase [Deltaproteobacteria bacterium]
MVFKNQSAKTFSRIAQALKVSKQDERPLAHIVQVVREHFRAEDCSLYEFRKVTLTLVATDKQDRSLEKVELPADQEQMQLVVRSKEALFAKETASVPLVYQEKVVGVLTLQRNQLNGFELPERQFLEFIALQLAGAIQSLTIAERAKRQIKEDQDPLIIRGIPVSSGFGIGPALFLNSGIISGVSEPDLSPHSTKNEWGNLQVALHKTLEELSHLAKKVENKFSKDESNIFESHRTILSDDDFLKKLEGEIEMGKSALEAVGHVLQEYVQQFEAMKNQHFEETAVDLEDLKQKILGNLLGIESCQEKEDWAGILVAKSLGPSDTIRLDASKLLGIITMTGGPTSHAAILARSLGIPAVMGAVGIMEKINPGTLLIVDGDKGKVIANPTPSILHDYELFGEERVAKMVDLSTIAYEPALTLDGHPIHLEANASFASNVKKLRYFGAEGIGLFRTEFLFLKGKELPNESEQFDLYSQMIRDAGGLPITFRILDAGGDKPIEALPMEKEENPFLGNRSIRLTLSHPHILKTQLRALLRASTFGSIRLLIPMISGMEEVDAIKEILEIVKQELSHENIRYDPQIPFGMMIEVPSAVPLVSSLIQHADFLSIGTNDLTQYTLAVDRNNEGVASFFEPLHPAVLSFISQIASAGLKAKKPVGICGEMASEPLIIPLLVGLGITNLSMIPSCILEAKKVIRQLNYKEAQKMAREALQVSRIGEVKEILARFNGRGIPYSKIRPSLIEKGE